MLEKRKVSVDDLSTCFKNLEKGEQNKTKARKQKAATRTEINKIEKK